MLICKLAHYTWHVALNKYGNYRVGYSSCPSVVLAGDVVFLLMPLTCAPSCLTLTVFPRTLKAGAFVILKAGAMGSKRLHSNLGESGLPTTDTIKKEKKLRGSMGLTPQSENGAIKGIAENNNRIDIQSMRDDLGKLDMMTVQELRTTLRSIGVPAKGCKRDLVSTLKCFLNSNVDGGDDEYISSEMKPSCSESAPLKKKSKNANSVCYKNIQDIKIVGEVSGLQQSKGRGKQFPVEDGRAEVNAHLVTTNQKLSIKTEVSGKKASQSKRKVSSEISLEDVRTSYQDDRSMNQTEPWTVLSHKKPQQGWIAYNPKTMRPPPPMGDTKFVKLMSWNVNGLRALLKLEGFSALELAQREDFDVLCLQETKLQEKDVEAVKQRLIDGYENSFWTCSVSKLGYSGTAIISRIKPLSVRYGLGISDHDSEGRMVTVEFDTFYLMSGYIPNSGDGLKRLSYRVTQWDLSLSNYMKELEKSKPVILTGDLNCAHQEIDIHNPAGNKRSAGFTDEERKSFEKNFLSRGFVDTFRKQHPGVVGYTYWGYRHGLRKTNKGWRLDYFLVSESIADKVHDSYILPDVGGSDHCPIGLILKL